jgi:hypothetical protein
MEDEPQTTRSWLTEGVIIAGIPAIAYFWTLVYEANFCRYFSIPIDFISLSPTKVLTTTALYFLTGVLLYSWFILLIAIQPLGVRLDRFSRKSPRNRAITTMLMFISMLAVYLSLSFFSQDKLFRIIGVILSLLIFIAFFLRPLLTQRKTPGYWNKFIADLTQSPETGTVTQSSTSSNSDLLYFSVIVVLVAWVIYGTYVFPGEGRNLAEKKEWFQVINESAELVVLRAYGDSLITAPLIRNPNGNQVEKTLYILPLSEISKTPLTLEKVGPLTIKQ